MTSFAESLHRGVFGQSPCFSPTHKLKRSHLCIYYANEQVHRLFKCTPSAWRMSRMEQSRQQRESSQAVFTSNSTRIKQQKWDTISQERQPPMCLFLLSNSPLAQKGSKSCDCSLFQATGHRCQTVPNPGFEREMTCRTWGQYNFETFDGLYYYFPGRCTYTLLKDCEETTQASIVVQVHNDPGCGSETYSCQRSVSLFLPWEGEIRLHATDVTFKGQSLQLPHHTHDLHVEQISHYVLVTQTQGFTLAWEGYSGSVYIKLSPEFVGRTCGLCGNFNADVHDDLKTSYGVLTHEIEMFGNSWTETAPLQAPCPMVPSSFPSPCTAVDVHVFLKVEEICLMLLDPPFQNCHDFVSPLSYMASCFNDICLSGPTDDAVCQVFTEYSRACAHADHPLNDWRDHIPQCVKECPEGLQYLECISCCPASCKQERTCIHSRLACLDGCYCPNGLIFEDGNCVTPSDCPCEFHGVFYSSGQIIQEECNNCTCVAGLWNCTEYNCPGECSVTGDMYFQSFDGRVYTFPATCQYVLAKSHNSGKFTVTIQNAPCGTNLDGSCIQSVNLVIDEDPKMEVSLSHIGEVFIAGQYRISLPYSDDNFHIQELSSMFLQVKTSFGLRLQYNWKEFRLYLQAPAQWKDDTVGLCGTFNGNIQDDFLSPAGMIESTPLLFGNAWKVSSACMLSLIPPQLDPCDTHQQAAAYASEMCDILNRDLFSACHEYLSPVPFQQQCRSDTCKCGTACFCSALAHYARHCRRFSVIIDFRSHVHECAVTCPATMQYGVCVSSCQRRCATFSSMQQCGWECEEGCVCPLGLFYNQRIHTCVHRSECPCNFLGADYEPGDVIMTSAGVQTCLDGKFVSQETDGDSLCPESQSYHNCSEGENGLLPGGGVACERTCESHLLNMTCSAHESCVSGCICPSGLLKHGDECFEPEACPCLWKGKEYYPGDKVSSPCHRCVCQHGSFQCEFRPCASMCTTYGDRHYTTFDGLLFDYIGACQVYLVKSSADVILSVTAENIDCFDNGIICRKSLLINIGRSFIAFDDDTGKPNPTSVMGRNQKMVIWPAGYFTVINFPEEDVTILWDRKTTIHIQVGPRWQGKLSGLCGNFDMKTVNEMRTPDNIDTTTPQEFGNSWTAAECVNGPDLRHPCTLSPLREPFAKQQCAVLLSEVFQACHPVVDVTWFYMNCLADTCGCNHGGDCECFCTSVAAYAHRCCHQGIPVDWRSPSLCPYDCEFYNKVLGKGPFRLLPFRNRASVLVASRSSGSVFVTRGNLSDTTGTFSHFMMTPGLSRARPHDTSRVSFEAAHRPNHFLYVSPSGQVKLLKWEESQTFWDGATFVLHRDTWVSGYDSLEAHAKPGFFLHATLPHIHLLKYRHTDSFRKATLFKLTGSGPDVLPRPQCQWSYDSCISPCFKTCSDPSAEACIAIPQVEGCLPVCPLQMVLDEVTRRCVYVEDCIKAPVILPVISTSAIPSFGPLSSTMTTASLKTTISPSAPSHSSPTTKITSTVPAVSSPPPISDESTRPTIPSSTTALPEPPKTAAPRSPLPPTVRPEVEEPLLSVKVTEAHTTAESATISPFGSSTPFAITSLFWLLSTNRPTDSLRPHFTPKPPPTTTVTTRSTEGPVPTSPLAVEESTETPHSVLVFPFGTTSHMPPVSESITVTKQTTVPRSTDTTYTESRSTKPETLGRTLPVTPITPALLPTASLTTSSLITPPPVKTPTASRATEALTSATTTHSVAPVEPFKTGTTTQKTIAPPIPVLATETVLLTTPAAPEIPASLPVHIALTTPVPSSASVTSDQQATSKTTTILESTVSKITSSTISMTAQPPPKLTAISEFTSTLSTTSKPPEIAVATTVATSPILSAKSTVPQVIPKETVIPPLSPSSITQTSQPWRPPHFITTSSQLYSPTTKTTPQHTSRTVPHVTDTESSSDNKRFNHNHINREANHIQGNYGNKTAGNSHQTNQLTNCHATARQNNYITIQTQEPGLLPPGITSIPVTTVQTTVLDRLNRTSSGVTAPLVSVDKTKPTSAIITPTTVSFTRMCTPPFAEIVDECTKFICVNNQLVLFNKSQSCPFSSKPVNCGLLGFAILVNGDKCCPQWECPCRCSVFPDLNVITFDGNSVAIYKAAWFIVTQLPNETVSVLVQECPVGSESPLQWNFTNLCLVSLNITHNSNHIIIDRLQRRLYVNSRYARPRFKKFGFEIYDTGNMYLIRSPAGLKLQWYHSTGMMVIDSDSPSPGKKLPTLGLCGFCDGDPSNDLTLANGSTVGRSEDPSLFIDSWQVPNTTSYVSHSRRREFNCSTSDCSQCLVMLQKPAFFTCHAFVSPSTFCEVWVQDVEYVNNQCVALAAYAASCSKFNICIEWRRTDYCPFMCPEPLRYQACLPACTSQSCHNQDFDLDPEHCSGLTEGCACPEGTLLHRPYTVLCIPPNKCACTDSSGIPRAHGEVWKASKDSCCMYRCDKDTVIPVEYNCSTAVAPVCQRAGEVVVSLADDTSCCPRKVCVCNQTHCDLLPPDCKYGEKLVSYYQKDSCCPDYVCECDPTSCEAEIPTCRSDQSLIATRTDDSCCPTHICICSSCADAPPLCLDGEVLTVSHNTTDRCCPFYQCVCEPSRCPQLNCPFGMSLVTMSSSDHCCANHTCVCSCDKITHPKCQLGEAPQLEQTFLSDTQNQCACKKYKCAREAVCVYQGAIQGVLRPGQTLVEHREDGLCYSRQCSRVLDMSSGFHILRTSSTNCSALCQLNQIYIPAKDQSTCCGVCKNISCLYTHENGSTILYKPGRSWVSSCMKFECTDTLSGPTLISYPFSCPPFNETECMKIGGTIVSYMDGCCKTCTGFPLFPFPVSSLTPTVNTNCERGKEDGKSCQKVTVRMTIRKNDCRSNRPVNIVSCDGKCPSASIYNYNINTYARFCKCCREMGLQRRSVQLYCSGNSTWVSYSIQEPTDCSCQWS
ncbi:otogelin [Vanacampus margaritifer]